VPLYERGYEKDPAKVAFEAVKQAERDGRDVVLVDTAGRMQDNEPLMRALSSLISVNDPQLVLFVGEALVGNDAVDQLTKFSRALQVGQALRCAGRETGHAHTHKSQARSTRRMRQARTTHAQHTHATHPLTRTHANTRTRLSRT
jgi:hypothetical protein